MVTENWQVYDRKTEEYHDDIKGFGRIETVQATHLLARNVFPDLLMEMIIVRDEVMNKFGDRKCVEPKRRKLAITGQEAAAMLPVVAAVVSGETKAEVVTNLLSELTDAQFLDVLAAALAKRRK